MDNTSNIPLVDILLLAEKNVERRLAVCLALHPKEVLILSEKTNVTPEIDAEVVEFWEKVQRRKREILDAKDLEVSKITLSLVPNKHYDLSCRWSWWQVLLDTDNTFDIIEKTIEDLRALKISRKAAIYVQKNRLADLAGV